MDISLECRDFGPFITNEFGDQYLYPVNRESFNALGSDALYQRIFPNNLLFQKETLHIIIGTDSGILPLYIQKRGLPQDSRFLFVELPEVYTALEESTSLLNQLDPNICITTHENWQKEAEIFYIERYFYKSKCLLHQSVAAMDAHLKDYGELHHLMDQELSSFKFIIRGKTGAEVFTVRQFENLAENRLSSICLKNAFKGKTAVVLGGGPSLDKAIPWIKNNREKIVVIAVSRVCRRLLECDLAPHMIFSIDPHPVSFDVSKDMLNLWKESLFLNHYHATPLLVGQWRGRNLYLGERYPWKTPLNEETLSSSGPNVTNTALAAAVDMGFSQVILAGVDLCFSREGHTYAQGTIERDIGPQLGQICLTVETNEGKLAETLADYKISVHCIGLQAEEALKQGCAFINSAISAAKIPNVIYRPLDDISIQDTFEKNVASVINELLPQETPQTRIAYYQTVLEELARANNTFRKIKKLAIEALKCNDGLFGRNGKVPDFKYKKQMDKIEKQLNTKFENFSPLVKSFKLREFIKPIQLDPDAEWDDDEIELQGKLYYETYKKSADELIKLTKKAQQRLRSRLEEENSVPDIGKLLTQWEADHQPGRYLLWKDRRSHACKDISASCKKDLERLAAAFKTVMQTKMETRHALNVKRRHNLASVRNKAFILFKRHDIEELELLAEKLELASHPEAKALLYLTQGYIAEIKGTAEDALQQYQQLLNEKRDEAILEDALKRIAFLSISRQDIDNSLAALECLTQLTPFYIPQYADMLRLAKQYQRAIETYNRYLSKMPDDWATMLKLGKLYHELNIHEAAKMAFNHVLDKNPENNTAKTLLEKLD